MALAAASVSLSVFAPVHVSAAGRSPSAPDNDVEGRLQFKRGEQFLADGKYREAAAAFEAGYAASPRSGFLLNIANCYRKLGELGKARQYYWQFLDAAPKNHASRPDVLAFLKAIEEIGADGVALDAAPPTAKAATAVPPVAPRAAAVPPVANKIAAARPSLVETPLQPPVVAAVASGPGLSSDSLAPSEVLVRQLPAPPPARQIDVPWYKRWWVWTAVGAVVVAGSGTLLLSRGSKATPCGASLGCFNE